MSLSELLKASLSTRIKAKTVLDSLEALGQRLQFEGLRPEQAFRQVRSLDLCASDAARIEKEIGALLTDERGEQLPLDTTIAAAPGIVMLSDLNEPKLFGSVSRLLQIDYLSTYNRQHPSPFTFKDWEEGAKGIVWGPLHRSMLTIPVTYTNQAGEENTINVHFVANSGGPNTELSPTVLRILLGVSDDAFTPDAIFVRIGGVRHGVIKCSPIGNHEDVPLLGVDFMQKIRGRFVADFDTEEVALVGGVSQGKQG
jgi:hypothetical protein